MTVVEHVKVHGAGEHGYVMELGSRDDRNRKDLPLDQNQLTSHSFFIPTDSGRVTTENSSGRRIGVNSSL